MLVSNWCVTSFLFELTYVLCIRLYHLNDVNVVPVIPHSSPPVLYKLGYLFYDDHVVPVIRPTCPPKCTCMSTTTAPLCLPLQLTTDHKYTLRQPAYAYTHMSTLICHKYTPTTTRICLHPYVYTNMSTLVYHCSSSLVYLSNQSKVHPITTPIMSTLLCLPYNVYTHPCQLYTSTPSNNTDMSTLVYHASSSQVRPETTATHLRSLVYF